MQRTHCRHRRHHQACEEAAVITEARDGAWGEEAEAEDVEKEEAEDEEKEEAEDEEKEEAEGKQTEEEVVLLVCTQTTNV